MLCEKPTGVDAEQAAAFLALAARHPDRIFVVGENFFYRDDLRGTPWRQWPQYRAGVRHIAQIRLLCGDIARGHGAVRAANSTIDAPSDLTLNLVFTGGAIGNYTASYPEIPVPPDFADAVQFGVRPVGSVAQSVANATVVQRALDSAERAAVLALDPVPGAGPVPLWRPCGSTGLFDGLPAQRISSSASFAA